MRDWIRLGRIRVFGAPIYVHWTVLLALAVMLPFAFSNLPYTVLFMACYLAIIFVHEIGHAFVASRLGLEVDSIGVTILHGWCRFEAPDYEWDEVLVAWGGVGAQVILALPALAIFVALGDSDWGYWTPVIVFLGYLNLALAAVNLLPDEDLDGRIAWRVVPLLLMGRK